MARAYIQRYWDIPDGTECHRKAYLSTSISGAVGELWLPGPEGGMCKGGHRVPGGYLRVA